MRFVAFDLETTGTKPAKDRIVEIGAVRFDGDQPVASYGTLVDPGIPIPAGASAVNGISDEMLRGQPRIESVLGGFADFCGNLPLVAHNAPFDFGFLLEAVKQHGGPAPGGVVLDSLALARRVFPGQPNYRLGSLVRHFGFSGGDFHRAEADSAYCGMLFARILQTLEARGTPCGVGDLLKLIGRRELRFPQPPPPSNQLDLF